MIDPRPNGGQSMPGLSEPYTGDMPLPVHTRAAFGDVEALGQLADLHHTRAVQQVEPAVIALAVSVIYARLAAIASNARDRWISFIFVLQEQANALRAAGLVEAAENADAEALAIAELMGDFGDEEMGAFVIKAGATVCPQALTKARRLHSTGIGVIQ